MSKKRILVIDDECELVEAIQIRLEEAGYEVISACDGPSGLEKAKTDKPDLILLDLMLPGMDGYKVCRMLKFDSRYSHIPVIMLTAKAQTSDEQTGYETGVNTFITKPFDHRIVLAKINELINI